MPEAAGQAGLLPAAPSASCPASARLSQGPVTFWAWPCSELAGGRTGMWVLKWGIPSTAPRCGRSSTSQGLWGCRVSRLLILRS